MAKEIVESAGCKCENRSTEVEEKGIRKFADASGVQIRTGVSVKP